MIAQPYQVLLGALAMLTVSAAVPSQVRAQTDAEEWEVRVVLDLTRHRMRRVRPILIQGGGGTLQAPSLGRRVLGVMGDDDMVGSWPGLGPEGASARPETLLGPLTPTSASDNSTVQGVPLLRRELEGTPGTQWFESSAAQPLWTAVLDDGGERVVTLRPPFSLPLVPDEVAVDTRNVMWVLRHDAQGDVSWALALGHAGMGDVNWEAYWRGSDDAPENLDAARAILPYEVVRHVLRTHGARTQWNPLAALGSALGSTRYNRVEGFSSEIPVWVEVQPGLRINGWVRPSTTSYSTGGGVSVVLDRWPDRWGIQAYRRLQDANLWEPAHRKGNSMRALFMGKDDGHYYTAQGLSLWTERIHGLRTWRVEIFREQDRFAEPRTSYHVLSTGEDTVSLGPTLLADDGEYTGIRGVFEQQWGLAPQDGVVVTRLWWGAATGSGEYVNVGGMVEGLKTWGGWAAGLRAGAGRAFGDAPLQRQYFLGGTTNVRGFPPASAEGPAVLLGRAEVGYGVPALRVIAFGDVGWVGEPSALRGLAAAGIGFSFGEGLLRLDLAKAVHGGSGFKVYLSGNGFL